MRQIVLKSFWQTFSGLGLDAISRSIGWVIVALLLLALFVSVAHAYSVSVYVLEFLWLFLFNIVTVLGLVIPLIFSSYILAPASILYGLIFQPRVAKAIEARDYAEDRPGSAVRGAGPFMGAARTFVGMIVITLASLPVSFIATPLGGIIFFLVMGGALLGRDQFVSVASRYGTVDAAKKLRRQNSWKVFIAGVCIAVFLLVPLLNLMMPVFSTILMVHLFKHVHPARQSAGIPVLRGHVHAGIAQHYR